MATIIAERRKELGLTQQELGQMLDPKVSFAAVSSWETGTKPVPQTRIPQLVQVLGVDLYNGARFPKEAERNEYVLHAVSQPIGFATQAVAVRLAVDPLLTQDRGDGLEFSGSVQRIADSSPHLTVAIVEAAIHELLDAGLLERISDGEWHLALKFAN